MAFPFARRRGPKGRRPARLHLEALEDRTMPSVAQGLSFAGNQSLQNVHDADTVVAANANYVLEITNDTLGIWNKSTGQLVSQQSLQNFWSPVQPANSPGGYYDVTGAWDDQANRWVLGTMYRVPTDPQVNNELFAVSNSADPTAGFSEMHSIPVLENDPTLGTLHGDFPLLGYNADEYTVAMNTLTTNGGAVGVKILTIPKGPVLDANPSTFTYSQTDFRLPNYYWEPAVMNDASPGAPQWFAEVAGTNTLELIKETNELSASPSFTTYKMTIPAFGAIVRSPQPGTTNTIDTGTTTYLSVAQRGNRLVVAQEVGTNGVTQARWYDFNIGGASPQMTQWGQFNPGPGVFAYDAGVNIAPNGDLGFSYMQSSASQYMSLYETAQEPGAPAGVTDPPVLVAAGTVPYLSRRNGDYTTVAIDPVTGGFWAAGQYAFPGSPSITNNWATYVSNFGTSSATHFALSVAPATAGSPTSVTVTALNGINATATGYGGTVHFSSSDQAAGLPANYTFAPGDNGQHTFANVVFGTPGLQSLQVTDTANGAVTGAQPVNVAGTTPPSPGDTLAAALVTPLGPGSGSYTNTATLGTDAEGAADVQMYAFQAGTGSTLTAGTGTPAGGNPMTAYLRLFDASGNELANSGAGTSLTYTFAAGGTYYLGVSGSPNTSYNPNVAGSGVAGSTGDYQLSASLSSPALSINNVSVAKPFSGSANAVFTVSLSTASAQTVSVNYSLFAGTARLNTDFTNVPDGTLTFAPGVLSQTVTVPIPGNTVRTGPRTFFVNLSGATNATIAARQGVGTIIDPNPLPTVTVNGVSTSVGSSGSKTLTFTVRLSAASAQEVTLNYATADGTAVAGTDYAPTSGMLVFYPGDTAENVPVTVFGYPGKDANQSFTLNLSNPTNAVVLAGQGVGTVLNGNTVSVTNASAVNGTGGTTPVTFTINLSSPVPAGAPPVVVQYATANGTAVAGVDYVANTGSVTFNPGDSSKTVTVLALGTPLAQPTKTFVLNITGASNATVGAGTKATGTILNNNPRPAVSVGNATAAEASSGNKTATFTVNLSSASGQTVTVQYATADGSAVAGTDYAAAGGTLTFKPGVTSLTVPVTVLAGTATGPNKNFTLNLSSPTNATLAGGQGTGTVVEAGALPTLSINNVIASMGSSGTKAFTFTVSLAPAVPAGGQPVTVQYATADGTAVAGTDYMAARGALTFAPGVTSQKVTVTVLGNPARVGDSSFTLNLSNPTNAAVLAGQGVGTIVNGNNTVSVTSAASATNGPGGTVTPVTFTISLSSPVPANGPPVVVQYATAPGGPSPGTAAVDYVATSGSVTFNPGDSSKTVSVLALGTSLNQATKTFLLNITGASNATVGANSRGTGTILNNVPAPLVNVSDAVVGEPTSGTRTLTFTVSLSSASGQTVTVQYATADGSAVAGTDYAAAGGTLTFKPGVTSQTVTITVYGDLNIDPDQVLYLNLMNATNAGLGRSRGTGTIFNDYA
jgi:hypothetical protein